MPHEKRRGKKHDVSQFHYTKEPLEEVRVQNWTRNGDSVDAFVRFRISAQIHVDTVVRVSEANAQAAIFREPVRIIRREYVTNSVEIETDWLTLSVVPDERLSTHRESSVAERPSSPATGSVGRDD